MDKLAEIGNITQAISRKGVGGGDIREDCEKYEGKKMKQFDRLKILSHIFSKSNRISVEKSILKEIFKELEEYKSRFQTILSKFEIPPSFKKDVRFQTIITKKSELPDSIPPISKKELTTLKNVINYFYPMSLLTKTSGYIDEMKEEEEEEKISVSEKISYQKIRAHKILRILTVIGETANEFVNNSCPKQLKPLFISLNTLRNNIAHPSKIDEMCLFVIGFDSSRISSLFSGISECFKKMKDKIQEKFPSLAVFLGSETDATLRDLELDDVGEIPFLSDLPGISDELKDGLKPFKNASSPQMERIQKFSDILKDYQKLWPGGFDSISKEKRRLKNAKDIQKTEDLEKQKKFLQSLIDTKRKRKITSDSISGYLDEEKTFISNNLDHFCKLPYYKVKDGIIPFDTALHHPGSEFYKSFLETILCRNAHVHNIFFEKGRDILDVVKKETLPMQREWNAIKDIVHFYYDHCEGGQYRNPLSTFNEEKSYKLAKYCLDLGALKKNRELLATIAHYRKRCRNTRLSHSNEEIKQANKAYYQYARACRLEAESRDDRGEGYSNLVSEAFNYHKAIDFSVVERTDLCKYHKEYGILISIDAEAENPQKPYNHFEEYYEMVNKAIQLAANSKQCSSCFSEMGRSQTLDNLGSHLAEKYAHQTTRDESLKTEALSHFREAKKKYMTSLIWDKHRSITDGRKSILPSTYIQNLK
ncbi:hypothetical protein ADUPG1_012224 [Aduncisulcus paluster]|uniref:Uncharacterized protein n=1 Tax=Aduncisulcus paluster TaxID=2918883 RepID=A0ABQ5JYR3_9EUKA|nr:hypothetical protein ADUPG1_012224 [Aduncisulcus paluster]